MTDDSPPSTPEARAACVAMNGIALVPCQYMEGVTNSLMLDGQLHVSEQFVAEAKVADQERLKELMAGCKVRNLGKSSDWISPKWPVVFDPPAEPFAHISFRSYWR